MFKTDPEVGILKIVTLENRVVFVKKTISKCNKLTTWSEGADSNNFKD